MHGQANIR